MFLHSLAYNINKNDEQVNYVFYTENLNRYLKFVCKVITNGFVK